MAVFCSGGTFACPSVVCAVLRRALELDMALPSCELAARALRHQYLFFFFFSSLFPQLLQAAPFQADGNFGKGFFGKKRLLLKEFT